MDVKRMLKRIFKKRMLKGCLKNHVTLTVDLGTQGHAYYLYDVPFLSPAVYRLQT